MANIVELLGNGAKRSRLIVLNGASSAGKTYTAEALLSLLGTQCIYTGFDDILERVGPFGPDDVGALGPIDDEGRRTKDDGRQLRIRHSSFVVRLGSASLFELLQVPGKRGK